jgi:hypothetical protein
MINSGTLHKQLVDDSELFGWDEMSDLLYELRQVSYNSMTESYDEIVTW